MGNWRFKYRSGKSETLRYASTLILITTFLLGRLLPSIPVGEYNLPLYIPYIFAHILILTVPCVKNKNYQAKLPVPILFLAGFSIISILSLAWGEETQGIIRAGFLLPSIIITCLIYWSSANSREIRNYARILLFVGAVAIFIGLIEIITGIHLPISRQFGTPSPNLATGWYHNPNNFAYTISFISFFYLSIALFNTDRVKSVAGIVGFSSIYYIILHSYARTALIAVTGGAIVIVCMYVYLQFSSFQNFEGSNVPLISLIVLLPLFMFVFVLFKNPFPQFSSIWYRWQLHEAGLWMVFQTSGLGTGIGSFAGYVSSLPILPNHSMAPHGWLPVILGELGLIGLVLFLISYGSTLKILLIEFTNKEDPIALTLFVALGSFIISGVGPSTPLVLEIHWAVWGISIAYCFTE